MLNLTDCQIEKVENLLKEMTIEEKIGQMNQETVSIVGGFELSFEELIEMLTSGKISQSEFNEIMESAEQDYHEEDIKKGKIGSMMLQDAAKANELQKIAVEESRLGIPLMIGLDVIHGFRTVYPIAIAEAGTFDSDLFERTARMAAKESRLHGVNWHFAPMIDIARDARWGRVSEGPGEDPYLSSEFAKAKVRGLQGDKTSTENYVASCLKHYVAYGACEGGRDYNTTSMSNSLLYNVYLPPFRAAVKEGAVTVMAAFNDLNGVPCTVNNFLLRDILKGELEFPGFVVSDANGINECITHGIAENKKDAGIQAARAGLDMDMGSKAYSGTLQKSVQDSTIDIHYIDDAVRRILSVKMWLGLFENPYVDENKAKMYSIPSSNIELALESAEKSIVLLKNEKNVLPLKKEQKISVVGELANIPSEVVGAWAISWEEKDCVSILEGMKDKGKNVKYFSCGGPTLEINDDEIQQAGDYGDVIVAVVGEPASMSGEAASRADITLPGKQQELLKKLLATGKPVIAVLMNGRPLALEWENENLDAIVESWHLGVQMGNAVARILYGECNPSGKLAASFPAVTGQCPMYYNHPNTGRPASGSKFTSRYLDAPSKALYPFGFGLSYTEFAYKDLVVNMLDESLEISVGIKNIGDIEGTEIVQLYVQDITASIVRPVKELKSFTRVSISPHMSETVSFILPKSDLGFYNDDGVYQLEDGKYNIFVGTNSEEYLVKEIEVKFD